MTIPASRVLFLIPLLVTAIAAQVQDPAPVRIAVEAYGSRSGDTANTLSLRLDALADGQSQIVVFGGPAYGAAVLLGGSRRTATPGPGKTVVLVSLEAIVPIGSFDSYGVARVPVDLVRKDLIGGTVFLQALSLGGPGPSLWLSAGLMVRFAAGTVQPKLGYGGPPSAALLIAEGPAQGRVHRVLHQVTVPTSGWVLTEKSHDSSGGVTRIYMNLESPGPLEITKDVVETKRQVIELGSQADLLVEVWIEQTQRTVIGPHVFLLAAQIGRDF